MAHRSSELFLDSADNEKSSRQRSEEESIRGFDDSKRLDKLAHAAEVLVDTYIENPEISGRPKDYEASTDISKQAELLEKNIERFERGEIVEREYELRHEIKDDDQAHSASPFSEGLESLGSILKSKQVMSSHDKTSPSASSTQQGHSRGKLSKTPSKKSSSHFQLMMIGVGIGIALSVGIILAYLSIS
ncbi:hypothetical protein BH23PAT2_BH23PAT2_09720 [soil metagenome]